MYNIAPPQDDATVEDDEEDIETSIKKELESYKTTKPDSSSEKRTFSVVRVVMDCVLFVKMRPPVQPVEFCRRICEDAKACTNLMERKTRYINRLTPVTAMDKASGNGIERAVKQALTPWFTLKSAPNDIDDSGTTAKSEESGPVKENGETERPAYTVSAFPGFGPRLAILMRNPSMQFGSLSATTLRSKTPTSSSRSQTWSILVTR